MNGSLDKLSSDYFAYMDFCCTVLNSCEICRFKKKTPQL